MSAGQMMAIALVWVGINLIGAVPMGRALAASGVSEPVAIAVILVVHFSPLIFVLLHLGKA